MTRFRASMPVNGLKTLLLLLAVLGMHALVPAGYMLSPTSGNGIAVTMCPVSNPLARAQAAMATGQGDVDHAAMGHGSTSSDEDGAPVAYRGDTSCAFSSTFLATAGANKPLFDPLVRDAAPDGLSPLPDLAVVQSDRLRPPLRAPPLRS